jgi:hypothetical protein
LADKDKSAGTAAQSDRKARLAEQLRANLTRRKAQTRSRRAGEADRRPDGLDAKPAEKAE